MTITLTREEAQQVLDALEEAKIDIFDWGQYASHHHREKYNLYGDTVKNDDLIETLRARLAQPEQRTGDCLLAGVCAAEGHRIQKAQPEPEPVAWMDVVGSLYHFKEYDTDKPLYTAPPQRKEWQGLTDEEKNEITWGKTVYEILDLAEAKLKEKNDAVSG